MKSLNVISFCASQKLLVRYTEVLVGRTCFSNMIFTRISDATRSAFKRHLFLTNITISGTLFGLGDALEQSIEIHVQKQRTAQDWARTGRMAATGMFVMGPLSHYWMRFLDRLWPLRDGVTIVKKVALDQFGSGPPFNLAFFLSMGTMEGKSSKEIWHEYTYKFWNVFGTACMIWIPMQAINFYFVSPQHRILYISCVFVLWNTLLSYFKHQEYPSQQAIVECIPVV